MSLDELIPRLAFELLVAFFLEVQALTRCSLFQHVVVFLGSLKNILCQKMGQRYKHSRRGRSEVIVYTLPKTKNQILINKICTHNKRSVLTKSQ